jgi:hypothetical protein
MSDSLRERQSRFVKMVGHLIAWADEHGYELTFGDAYRDSRVNWTYGARNSKHRVRLAVDFNLYIDGVYQTSTEAHAPLGEYWESIGGVWGGRWNDGNHYQAPEA